MASILDRMEKRNRDRQAIRRSRSSSAEVDPENEYDPEADADNEVSDDEEPLTPDPEARERASGPDRQVKSTRKLREESNMVPKKSSSK